MDTNVAVNATDKVEKSETTLIHCSSNDLSEKMSTGIENEAKEQSDMELTEAPNNDVVTSVDTAGMVVLEEKSNAENMTEMKENLTNGTNLHDDEEMSNEVDKCGEETQETTQVCGNSDAKSNTEENVVDEILGSGMGEGPSRCDDEEMTNEVDKCVEETQEMTQVGDDNDEKSDTEENIVDEILGSEIGEGTSLHDDDEEMPNEVDKCGEETQEISPQVGNTDEKSDAEENIVDEILGSESETEKGNMSESEAEEKVVEEILGSEDDEQVNENADESNPAGGLLESEIDIVENIEEMCESDTEVKSSMSQDAEDFHVKEEINESDHSLVEDGSVNIEIDINKKLCENEKSSEEANAEGQSDNVANDEGHADSNQNVSDDVELSSSLSFQIDKIESKEQFADSDLATNLQEDASFQIHIDKTETCNVDQFAKADLLSEVAASKSVVEVSENVEHDVTACQGHSLSGSDKGNIEVEGSEIQNDECTESSNDVKQTFGKDVPESENSLSEVTVSKDVVESSENVESPDVIDVKGQSVLSNDEANERTEDSEIQKDDCTKNSDDVKQTFGNENLLSGSTVVKDAEVLGNIKSIDMTDEANKESEDSEMQNDVCIQISNDVKQTFGEDGQGNEEAKGAELNSAVDAAMIGEKTGIAVDSADEVKADDHVEGKLTAKRKVCEIDESLEPAPKKIAAIGKSLGSDNDFVEKETPSESMPVSKIISKVELEVPDEVIDSILEGISSDEDNSDEISNALEGMSSETGSETKTPESDPMNAVIDSMEVSDEFGSSPEKVSDSEAIESFLQEICEEENKKAVSLLSDDDDGSMKDGLDIESVIDSMCEEENQVNAKEDEELKTDSKATPPRKDDVSGNSVKKYDKGDDDDGYHKDVHAVMHAICNIVNLQLDQDIRSEKIAYMESIVKKKDEDEAGNDAITKDAQKVNEKMTSVDEVQLSDAKADARASPRLPPFLPSHLVQAVNENSSDSEKSSSSKIKMDESVRNIIMSLSSPKPDSNDMDVSMDNSESSVNSTKVVLQANDSKECDMGETSKSQLKEESSELSLGEETISASEAAYFIAEQGNKSNTVTQSKSDNKENAILANGECSESEKNESCSDMMAEFKEDINNFRNQFSSEEYIKIPTKDLSDYIRLRVYDFCQTKYARKLDSLDNKLVVCKQEIEEWKKCKDKVRAQIREFATQQTAIFRQHGYNPKVEKRTVGVNVRIVQQSHQSDSKIKAEAINKVKPQMTPPASPQSKALGNFMAKPPLAVTPSSTTYSKTQQSNVPPNTVLYMTPSGELSGARPVVVGQPQMASSATVKQTPLPLTTSVMLVTTNTTTTSSSHQFVDLTGDGEAPKARIGVTTTVPARTTGVMSVPTSKAPGASTNTQLPVPLVGSLPSMVQLVPSGSTITSSQEPALRMIRPTTVIPPGARFAYIVPQGSSLPGLPLGNSPPRQVVNTQSPQPPPGLISGLRQPISAVILAPVMTTTPQTINPPTRATSMIAGSSAPTASTTTAQVRPSQITLTPCFPEHPAPLPQPPVYPNIPKLKMLPPQPSLKMNKVSNGIVLSWNMNLTNAHAEISTYQLYAYQENKGPVSSSLWKKVGDIKALPLPMACTLTQFIEGHKYHFTVRAVDVHKRVGSFSVPCSIKLLSRNQPETKPDDQNQTNQ